MRLSLLRMLALLCVTVLATSQGRAQNSDQRTAVSLSGSAYQYKGSLGSDFWKWDRNKYGPGIGINRYLTSGADLGLHLGYVELKGSQSSATFFNTNVVNANLALKLKLNNGWALKEESVVQPYLLLAPGLAFTSREGQVRGRNIDENKTYFDAFGAAGITFRLSDAVGIFLQTGQHFPLNGNIDGEFNRDANKIDDRYLQHTLGVTFGVGKPKDTDADGVPDRKDKCPGTPAGVKVDANGCPLDGDADGVPDYQDKCPTEKGLPTLEGCPDRDNDGVRDSEDACPDAAGTAALKGCPDTDADGVADPNDKCPGTPAGTPVDANGCPLVVDKDSDGVLDSLDRCPDTPAGARVDSVGCPLAIDPKTKALEVPIRFRTNSTIIDRRSYPTVNKLVRALKDYPDYMLRIAGHADSRGTEEYNQGLSERRAEAVKRYFTGKGVDPNRIVTEGHGELEPVVPNTTPANMARNRRVEFHFDYMPAPTPTPPPTPQP
ncbi:OmpA family protein [Hymenobacter sp. BT770]|uniref:OmpA family protein n=1 Tax=Hymenobacter sp. BT770 TaxID=2886942 RepID=UPI002671235A|nr:OmpA family protein [Hymenobacter sp. BT770]MDO3417224.1 OmpA family protein [Hymenobacter sp. BT770]